MRTTRRAAIAGCVLTGVLVMAACSAGSDGDSADSASGGSASESRAPEAATDDAAAPVVDLATARAPERAQEVISTADLRIEAKNPETATAQATEIARGTGGYLFSQQATLGDDASVEAVYKVPPAAFDATIDAFAEIGDVKTRDVDTEDVTGSVVALEARLASARTSVDRLRELLTTSGSVNDLLAVEQTLAQREAEAESLAAQLGALRSRVDLATITLHVATIPPAAAAEVSNDIPGFLRGLDTGAAAFGNTVLVVATALGFALPFLAVALLAAIPFWYFTRRRRFATRA
jgi:hypothetical protein